MANHSDPSFSDFPEDVQLCILSFLTPEEISTFACTSKQFGSLCRNDSSRLWYSMCDRKWGFKTQINKWGDGKIGFNKLYEKLSEYENLIGFWRRSGGISGEGGISGDAPLVFFEWGDSCVIGSRVTPCKDGSYNVIKSPFIWMSLSSDGQPLNYLKNAPQKDSNPSMDMIQVNVNFMGKGFVVLEESIWNFGKSGSSPDANGNGYKNFDNVVMGSSEMEIGSPPDQIMSDMYQHYANRRSPGAGGVRAWRRQRRREKERQVRRTLEPEYLVKLDCSPTRTRPLQGLWKVYFLFIACDFTIMFMFFKIYMNICLRVVFNFCTIITLHCFSLQSTLGLKLKCAQSYYCKGCF